MSSRMSSFSRRELLRTGLVGFSSLSLAELFRIRAMAASEKPAEKTAVILEEALNTLRRAAEERQVTG